MLPPAESEGLVRCIGGIDQILANIPNPTVVELGAHRGVDTAWLYAACRGDVKYLAVEPDYRHWEDLKAVCYPRGIRTFYGAVGATNGLGRLRLAVHDELRQVPASSSLREPKLHLEVFPWCLFEEGEVDIPVMGLDSMMRAFRLQPDFIWADIQGCEGDMIEGGRGTLSKTKWLYCESYDCEMYAGQMLRPEFLRVMGELGFEQVDTDRDNVLLRNRLVLPPAQGEGRGDDVGGIR